MIPQTSLLHLRNHFKNLEMLLLNKRKLLCLHQDPPFHLFHLQHNLHRHLIMLHNLFQSSLNQDLYRGALKQTEKKLRENNILLFLGLPRQQNRRHHPENSFPIAKQPNLKRSPQSLNRLCPHQNQWLLHLMEVFKCYLQFKPQ